MPLTFLITAGPTQEPIDPVRYISNHSSGKMGYALAEEVIKLGHRVLLITGPTALTPPKKAQVISVVTALDMYGAVIKHYKKADIIIMVAAVADYRPIKIAGQKIKKNKSSMTLNLIKNPDILKILGQKKNKEQILVGFAAETQSVIKYAQKKLVEKNCDWMIANNVSQKGIGFGSKHNELTLLSKKGEVLNLRRDTKKNLAKKIIKILLHNNS